MSKMELDTTPVEQEQQGTVEEAFVKVEKKRKQMDKKAKKKRKKIVIFSILGAIVALIIVVCIVISAISKNMPMMVTTQKPTVGPLQSSISISGNIESEKVMHYIAPANMLVDEVVSAGTAVEKGETIVAFDADQFAQTLRETQLNSQIASNTYQSNLTDYNDAKAKLADANARVAKYQALVDSQQAVVDNFEATVTDANAKKIATLQNKIYEEQKKLSDFNYCIQHAAELGMTAEGVKTYTEYAYSSQQAISNLQYELSLLGDGNGSYEQAKAISDAKNLLSDYKKELELAKADRDSYQKVVGNQYDAENIVLNGELSTMKADDVYEEVQNLQDGVKADFSGIVTQTAVTDDSYTTTGMEMITLASMDDLKVVFSVAKNDLKNLAVGQKATITILGNSYEGTVTAINRMASPNQSGVSMVTAEVHIDNPDENIYLGLEAKMVITTAELEETLMIPVEAVNADKTGDFVFVIEEGLVAKRYVTTGISSDEYIEILEGLTEEDEIISMVSSELEEGIPVTPIPDVTAMTETESEGEATVEE